MPSDTDAIPGFPLTGVLAERLDHARNLMSRRSRIADPRQNSLFRKHVAMTNPARLNLNPHLPARRLDNLLVNQLEGPFGLFDSNGFHVFISINNLEYRTFQNYPRINLKSLQ
jgi:hypothetical protein